MEQTLKEALERAWSARRRISFYDLSGLSRSLSFAQLGAEVDRFASLLGELGVGPGTVVAVMAPTGLDLSIACLAVWQLEATLTVLPPPPRFTDRERFAEATRTKLERSRTGLLLGEEGAVGRLRGGLDIPVCSFEEIRRRPPITVAKAASLRPPAALIQFSSGTTRDPKPILLSAPALLRNARAVLRSFPGGAESHSCASWLPLYHDMGLIGCFLIPLLAPADLTLIPPEVFAVRPFTWLQAISEQRATTSSCPNFALAHCTDSVADAKLKELDLSCWRIAMVGAEAVRPRTLRRFARRFAAAGFQERAFSPVYGLAEATLAVTFSPLGEGLRTLGYDLEELSRSGRVIPGGRESPSLGRPLEGIQVEIREGDRTLPEGRLGEVWVKSPSLLSGILGSAEEPLREGWLATGDAGFLVAGELYLYGRRRDILLLDGRNHDPSVLEEAAETVEGLRRCCAFVWESEEERDVLVLLCEVSLRFKGEPEALVDAVRTACRRWGTPVPDRVELLRAGELPLTSSGKLRRREAAARYGAGELLPLQGAAV